MAQSQPIREGDLVLDVRRPGFGWGLVMRLDGSTAVVKLGDLPPQLIELEHLRRKSDPRPKPQARSYWRIQQREDYDPARARRLMLEAAERRKAAPPVPPAPTPQEVAARIHEAVAGRGISRVVHFTRTSNLASILKTRAILSREKLNRAGLEFRASDLERFDGHPEAVSVSIEFPNYRMFYKKRSEDTDKAARGWVVLELEPSLLWECECSFHRENAASGTQASTDYERLRSIEAFESMFADYDSLVGTARRGELDIPDSYPTNPQAEVLVANVIPRRYLRRVLVTAAGEAAAREAIEEQGGSIPVQRDESVFLPRCDSDSWNRQ